MYNTYTYTYVIYVNDNRNNRLSLFTPHTNAYIIYE